MQKNQPMKNHELNEDSQTTILSENPRPVKNQPKNKRKSKKAKTTNSPSEEKSNTRKREKPQSEEQITKDHFDEWLFKRKPRSEYKKTEKTRAQRNKEHRKRVRRAIARQQYARARLNAAFERIELIKAKLDRLEKQRAKREAIVQKRKAREALDGIKRLGATKYKSPDLDVLLPDELPSKLSHIQYSGPTIWEDRLNSFRKRNIIETRQQKFFQRKYRKQWVERYDYKVYNRAQEKTYADLEKQFE